jgi:pyruvate-formate lyase
MAELESILETKVSGDAWRDFVGGSWEKHVNVREFIQMNPRKQQMDVINCTFHQSM